MKQTSLVILLALWTLFSPALTGCRKESAQGGAGVPPVYATQAVVTEAKVQPVNETLSLVGSVAANEMVEIKSETDGTLEEVLFTEGQRVKQGDLLIRLDESKFIASVNEAEANFKLSETTYERNKQLQRDKLVSQQEYDQAAAQYQANKASLELKKRLLKDARIYAPFKGTMSSRQVSPGQVIAKNTTLTWLIDLDPVKVELNVPERFVSQLQVGQKIEITVAAYPGRTFAGEVFFVAPTLDPATRRLQLKAWVPNPSRRLRPGMFANLDLKLGERSDALMVPDEAVVYDRQGNYVWRLGEGNVAERVPVEVGAHQEGLVEIVRGVRAGDVIVSAGTHKVTQGAVVRPVAPTLAEPPAAAPGPAPVGAGR